MNFVSKASTPGLFLLLLFLNDATQLDTGQNEVPADGSVPISNHAEKKGVSQPSIVPTPSPVLLAHDRQLRSNTNVNAYADSQVNDRDLQLIDGHDWVLYDESKFVEGPFVFDGSLTAKAVALGSGGGTIAVCTQSKTHVYISNGPLGWVKAGEEDLPGGTTVAISPGVDPFWVAIGNSEANDGLGKIQVFEYKLIDNAWEQYGRDIDGTNNEAMKCGASLDLKILSAKAILAVGCPFSFVNTSPSTDIGVVRMYETLVVGDTSNDWEEYGNDIVGVRNGDNFGRSVSLNARGTRVHVGAPNGLGSGRNGNAKTFEYDESSGDWLQYGSTMEVDNSIAQNFGVSLSDGEFSFKYRTVVANPYNGGGTARVYQYDVAAEDWEEVAIFPPVDDFVVLATVAMSEDAGTVAIGRFGSVRTNGEVTVMEREDESAPGQIWRQKGRRLNAEDDGVGLGFSIGGVALSSDGNTLAVLEYTDSDTNPGFWFHVYEHKETTGTTPYPTRYPTFEPMGPTPTRAVPTCGFANAWKNFGKKIANTLDDP